MGIYERNKIWYVDFYHPDGRRIRRKAGSKKDAKNVEAALKADVLRSEYRFKRLGDRFEDFAKEYLEYVKVNKNSWKRSDKVYLNKLIPFFKGKRLSKITPKIIEDYKRIRIDEVKPATVNRELACLKFMFSLAKKWKRIDENPVKEVRLFHEQKLEMRIMSKDEIERLLAESSEHLKQIIILALNTGMRRGEIFELKWRHIDFDKSIIYVWKTKSNNPRKIPMNGLVASTLKRIKRESEYIFYNPVTKDKLTDIKTGFKAACRRAKIHDLRFHDLRHTAATYMVTGGVDLVTVAEILGHADIKTTMRYAHPTPENKRKAVEVLAAVFGGGSGKIADIEKSSNRAFVDLS